MPLKIDWLHSYQTLHWVISFTHQIHRILGYIQSSNLQYHVRKHNFSLSSVISWNPITLSVYLFDKLKELLLEIFTQPFSCMIDLNAISFLIAFFVVFALISLPLERKRCAKQHYSWSIQIQIHMASMFFVLSKWNRRSRKKSSNFRTSWHFLATDGALSLK